MERGHGRTDARAIKTLPVTLRIAGLFPDQADPGDLLAYLRGHRAIEMHHYVRDVLLGEDASRTGGAHRAMAAVRNTVTGILHLHRIPNIAAQAFFHALSGLLRSGRRPCSRA